MHIDPTMPAVVGTLLGILTIGIILRRLRQPHVVAYLVAGVIVGPEVLGLVSDNEALNRLGAVGVVLLLFFVGMEVSPRRFAAGWKIMVIGTLFQILVSVGVVWVVGVWLDWSFSRILLIGFVISLSSTAVVLRILQERNELDSNVGQHVLGVLLAQDLAVIPMLIILGVLGGKSAGLTTTATQLGGGMALLALLTWLSMKEPVRLPLGRLIRDDQEMQVFAALAICFGLALLTGLAGLSTALGAFVAGMVIGAARETQWVHHRLESFRVLFLALFFVSIGTLVDLDFLLQRSLQVGILVLAVLFTNTFLNAAVFRILGEPWRDSLYAGALLSQIGEFSFALAAVGLTSGIITANGYQLAIAVIALSLLVSPGWISLMKRLLRVEHTPHPA